MALDFRMFSGLQAAESMPGMVLDRFRQLISGLYLIYLPGSESAGWSRYEILG
jgi:hypothetical protein